MKKYSKLIIAAIIALIFIGTFVFLWQKSQPKEVVYNEFTPKLDSIQKTTIITGKIEPRNEVNIKQRWCPRWDNFQVPRCVYVWQRST